MHSKFEQLKTYFLENFLRLTFQPPNILFLYYAARVYLNNLGTFRYGIANHRIR